MRIAQVATLLTPVSRGTTGSIESMVWALSEELLALGHEVTVFGMPGSRTSAELIGAPVLAYDEPHPASWYVAEWVNLCQSVREAHRFDVIHTHAYLWGAPLEWMSPVPLVHTCHVMPGEDERRLVTLVRRGQVTAISRYQWAKVAPELSLPVIHHGIDVEQFPFTEDAGDYLCFLGSFIPGKGPLDAIAMARSMGLRLLLAGRRTPYFDEVVKPHVDGRYVEYLGLLAGDDRARLLGGAQALIYPVRDPEPFGLVLIEAMMCGTPVAAVALGAVPELVDDGVTGRLATGADDLCRAASQAILLPRPAVRAAAELRFPASRMAAEYAALYSDVVRRTAPLEGAGS